MKKMKCMAICVVGIMMSVSAFADGESTGVPEALNPKVTTDWNFGSLSESSKSSLKMADGEDALFCKGAGSMVSKEMFKIEPGKKYRISGFFKAAPNSAKPSKFFLGIVPLDKDGGRILHDYIGAADGTDTELAADCNQDDMIIKIKNGEKWHCTPYHMITFNTDDSGNRADLPNMQLSGTGIVKIEKKGDNYEVTLKEKCGQKYGAGTKIREHRTGSSYIYFAGDKVATPEWEEVSATFSTKDKDKCWPGTCGATIIILANYGGTPEQAMLIKDVKIEEVK